IQGGGLPLEALKEPKMLLNLLFLGVLGSGICYVLWSKAVLRLGVVKTNNYIYVSPFVTLLTGAIFLSEPITPMGIFGALLIISGVIICSKKPKALTAK
ncbi:MAG: EamA family transporter, partial [Acutalibacteraceae bacterium]